MKMNKNTMTDSSSDFFQLLNAVSWEGESLKNSGDRLKSATAILKMHAQDGEAPRKSADEAIEEAQKILDDVIYRARLTKTMLENYKKLL